MKYKTLFFLLLIAGTCLSPLLIAQEESAKPVEGRRRRQRPGGSRHEDRMRAGRPMRPTEQPADPNDPNEPTELLEAINLNNIEMKNVMQKIAEWTDKPVIPTSDEVMKVRISIYSPKKLPRADALSLLMSALHSKGVVAEELDDVIFLSPLASVRLGSVPTVGTEDTLARIEDKNSIVEKWFQLNSYSPTQLIQIINPLIAEYGYAVADEGTMRVAVIDTVENLMRIERLINQLDIPESNQEIEKVFKLEHGDPLEIVQVLQIILKEQSSSQSRRSSGNFNRRGSRQEEIKNAVSVTIGTDTTSIRLIPMTKQRWILARASREDMQLIEEWIKKLDISDTTEVRQTVVQVRYANVREVARMVQNTIQKMPGTDVQTNVIVEALPQSNQIVIYGSEPNRKMVERLIAEIDLPEEDIFEDETFDLKHADPDEIKKKIDELYDKRVLQYSYRSSYSSSSSYRFSGDEKDTVKVIAYPLLKQVTVIATKENLKKIADQIKEWDIPVDLESDQYRILSLKNSDPVQLATLLNRLFTEDSNDSRNFIRMLFSGRSDSDSQQKIVGSLYGTLTFEPVPDTKKLIVISKIPQAYDVIAKLVEKLDSQETAEVPRVITLNYADAEDLCDQLNAILNEPGTPATIRRQVEGLSDYDPEAGSSAIAGQENDAGTITPWWTRQQRNNSAMPFSNLIGQVRFIPVHRSKAILVLSPPEYIDDITNMVKELDKPGMQVMIKVIIVDINLSDATSLGVQYASDPSAFGTLGVNAATALNELTYSDFFTAGETGLFEFSTGADISVLVDLLVKEANGRILNQPTLWTKDNEEAVWL